MPEVVPGTRSSLPFQQERIHAFISFGSCPPSRKHASPGFRGRARRGSVSPRGPLHPGLLYWPPGSRAPEGSGMEARLLDGS
jgi:hypothetical protein